MTLCCLATTGAALEPAAPETPETPDPLDLLGDASTQNTKIRLAVSCLTGNTEPLGEELFARWTYVATSNTGKHDEGCFNSDSVSQDISTSQANSVVAVYEDDTFFNDAIDVASGSCTKSVSHDYTNQRFTIDGTTYNEGNVVTISGGGGTNCPTAGSVTFTFWYE